MTEVRVIANPASFRNEARYQRTCAVCDKPGRFVAHHVVYEQHLRNIGLRGNALFDTRNALGTHSHCHTGKHHSAMGKIQTFRLRDENIEYAFEVLGPRAYDYLRRYYDDSGEDPRIKLALEASQ
jgi:hypothetical protein